MLFLEAPCFGLEVSDKIRPSPAKVDKAADCSLERLGCNLKIIFRLDKSTLQESFVKVFGL